MTGIQTEPQAAAATSGAVLAELSRRLVQIMRRETGRGPTHAKTHWAGPDLLVTVLGDVFLPSEKTLLDKGKEEVAIAYRGALQSALRDRLREEVERITGREVVAVMSCANHAPDLMVELFVFEPRSL